MSHTVFFFLQGRLFGEDEFIWVVLGDFDFDALPWHVFDVPRSQLHLLAVNNVDCCLLNRLLIHI